MCDGVVSCSLQTPSIRAVRRSYRAPLRVALQQATRLRRALRTRRIGARPVLVLRPALEDGVADAPLGLDLVVAREQGGVAAHGVEDQTLVRLRRLGQER